MNLSDKKAVLKIDGVEQEINLPVYSGTVGPDVIDVRSLYKSTGMFTYDPGFMSTASCNSKITFIDGEKGELSYRGYPIEQLATKCGYLEVCYLILNGELPNAAQKEEFEARIKHYSVVNEQMHEFLHGFRRDSHPMAMLTGLVGGAASFYRNPDLSSAEERYEASLRIISIIPMLVAMAYRYSKGLPNVYPHDDFSYAGNFMRMMFSRPNKDYEISPVLEHAMDVIFTLHADHEQNASTSTVRLCGSSGTNPYAAIAAGVACLWGPAHGGANEACLNMLNEIQAMGGVAKVGEYMEKCKDKNSGVRLMGFGHRVYKNYDPRAKIMQKICNDVLDELDLADHPLFALAKKVEQIALEDEFFIQRKLYPNVDFYSGIIQSAMGIPVDFFTCIFALARTSGWIAQWNEMISDPEYKIGRPRQLFVGAAKRDVKDISER